MTMFVEGLQLLHQVQVTFDAQDVGVVEEVEKEAEQGEKDQGDPVVAQEESQQRHCGVFRLPIWSSHKSRGVEWDGSRLYCRMDEESELQ